MGGLSRAARAMILIGVAAAALALGSAHALVRVAAPAHAHSHASPAPRPLFGIDELGLMAVLRSHGADVRRVDRAPWAASFTFSSADVITTDSDQFFVFAPYRPGQGRWVCRAELEGAIIGGGDAPAYDISVGGERQTIQFAAPDAAFWDFGELIVLTPTEHAYELVSGGVAPVTCPHGQ